MADEAAKPSWIHAADVCNAVLDQMLGTAADNRAVSSIRITACLVLTSDEIDTMVAGRVGDRRELLIQQIALFKRGLDAMAGLGETLDT